MQPAGTKKLPASAGSLGDLWLETFARLSVRASHELKNSLNAVAVNLEVVRSRLERASADVAGLAGYATNAAGEFGRSMSQIDAMFALARPCAPPTEVATVVRHLAALLEPSIRADAGELRIDSEMGLRTTAEATLVRTLLAQALLPDDARGASIRVVLSPPDTVLVYGAGRISEAAVEAGKRRGVSVRTVDNELRLRFPTAPRQDATA